ncbi:MAG TPA: uracil-DNA glycosylase [Candidatus Saccharimonadales bacterium]|nr:uracil-DNA glycosylase [Candidatus Saccharimonadales bacterium]
MLSKLDLLEQVRADIEAKNICPNLAESASHLVMGDGSPDADIVFIGEAPGKNEDEQGLPFVGAAGKFLNEMLASINLERKDVFITNIVKYRPPNNRDPLPEEKQAFWPYLARQLEIIEPKVIVTLGRHSMEFFLPDKKISQIHGQPKKLPVKLHDGRATSWIILPLYHPAAALYNGGMRQTLIDDFQVVKGLL